MKEKLEELIQELRYINSTTPSGKDSMLENYTDAIETIAKADIKLHNIIEKLDLLTEEM